jgi:hypothetical protein
MWSFDPSYSVVHLTMRRGLQVLAVGSGMLYRRNDATFIVTAWHNVTGRHPDTFKILHSKGGVPDNLIANIACRAYNEQGFQGILRRGFTIPLEDAMQTFYFEHPQTWPRIDVVAIPIEPEKRYDSEGVVGTGERIVIPAAMREPPAGLGVGFDIACIQDFEPGSPLPEGLTVGNYLSLGSDLFILGYPKGIVDMNFQPLWKRATVASSPALGWERQKKFLVDCASREGMSGAPAITHSSNGQLRAGTITILMGHPVTLFHGIYTSRVGGGSEFEAQIGTIWSEEVIPEIIEAGRFAPHSSELELPESEIDAAIAASWPQQIDNYEDMILGDGSILSHTFTHSLMTKLGGRTNPEAVRAKVIELAKKRTEERQ